MKLYLSISKVIFFILFFNSSFSFADISGDCLKAGSPKLTFTCFKKSALQGNASAQLYLGFMYDIGQEVVKNYATAVKWYTKSALQGDALAQLKLGTMYDRGQGVVKNYATAVKWYTKSALQGHASAQYNLGIMYDRGQGVVKNYVMAYAWSSIASSKGQKSATQLLNILEKKMTSSQIAKAQELGSKLQSKNLSEELN